MDTLRVPGRALELFSPLLQRVLFVQVVSLQRDPYDRALLRVGASECRGQFHLLDESETRAAVV